MEYVLTIYLIKLFGWVHPYIKYISYIILIVFFFKTLSQVRFKKNDLILYVTTFISFIFLIVNYFTQAKFYNGSLQTIGMYIYTFALWFFIIMHKNTFNPKKVLNIFIIFSSVALVLNFMLLYDTLVAKWNFGFINFVKDNVATLYYARGCGFFSDPTAHATIVFSLLFMIYGLYQYKLISNKEYKFFLMLTLLFIIFSTSKIVIILTFIALIIFYIFTKKKILYIINFKYFLLLLFIFIALLIIYFHELIFNIYQNIENIILHLDNSRTVNERIWMYSQVTSSINDNLFFGLSFNGIQSKIGISVHNTFLQIFSDNGLFGIFFFLIYFIFIPFVYILNMVENKIKIITTIYCILFLIRIQLVDIMHTHESFIYIFTILYLVFLDRYIQKQKRLL